MPLKVQNKVSSLTHMGALEHEQLIVTMPSNQSTVTHSIMLNAFIDANLTIWVFGAILYMTGESGDRNNLMACCYIIL